MYVKFFCFYSTLIHLLLNTRNHRTVMHLCNNSTVYYDHVGAVGTSNLHPDTLVLEGDDVTGTKLDMGDFKNRGSIIVLVLLLANTVFSTTPSPSTPESSTSSD